MQKLQLSIPEPCHQNWQQMTPTGQGRFCNACAKEVVDFSMMTDTEVLNYFSMITHQKVCGRALPSQLERTICKPKEPKKRLFWYWNYIVMFFIFFTKVNTVKAQGAIKPVTELSPVKTNEIVVTALGYTVRRTNQVITGKITDVNGNPVSFASIKIKGTSTEKHADANGIYSLKVKQNDTLFISGISFKSADVLVGTASIINTVLEKVPTVPNDWGVTKVHRHARFIRKAIAVNIDSLYVIDSVITTKAKADSLNPDDISDIIKLEKSAAMTLYGSEGANGAIVITTRKAKEKSLKEVVVTSGFEFKGLLITTATVTKTNLFQDTIKTLLSSFYGGFKVYPNPVQRGEQFNLSFKSKQTGQYQIQITDATGRIVLQKQINVLTEEVTEKIPVDSRWSSGVYYINLINNKSQLVNKKSFIVR